MIYTIGDAFEAPYECSKCGREVSESYIDNEMSEAFVHVCIGCAEEMRAEED